MTTGFSGPIEDRMALRDLLDTYADAVTRRDAADWAACWSEDAQWSLPDFAGVDTVVGRNAIVELWNAAMAQVPGLVFQAWPGAIRVDGDRATMRSYTRETFQRDGAPVTMLGTYEDICGRHDRIWQFHRREFRSIG